jgi:3-dehydroquinate synthase
MTTFIFLYGPPGSGKTTLGRPLAERFGVPFYDLDRRIEIKTGKPIHELFASEGERNFRELEYQMLGDLLSDEPGVVSLGGGALTVPKTYELVSRAGPILFLDADLDILVERMKNDQIQVRPLLANGDLRSRLETLLQRRKSHYQSFTQRLDTGKLSTAQAIWEAQIRLGRFRLLSMGQPYEVRIRPDCLSGLGSSLRELNLRGPIGLVSDEHVWPRYGAIALDALVSQGYAVQPIVLPPGENHKTIYSVSRIWQGLVEGGIERSSTIVAMGGGVIGDLAGFAAATYLRGVRWVNVPTSLLAMVDASIGGKTGADLPQGKNLIGAFHPPSLVLVDPVVLESLPNAELRSGLAELVKHAVIGDPALLDELLVSPLQTGTLPGGGDNLQTQGAWALSVLIGRAMAIKMQIIEEDPYEKGRRAALNLGHTIGHALEQASGYQLRHGEAVAIGMVCEARMAEKLGLATPGLSNQLEAILSNLELPTRTPPTLDRASILHAMLLDKKRKGGQIRFALPLKVGEVAINIAIEPERILEAL